MSFVLSFIRLDWTWQIVLKMEKDMLYFLPLDSKYFLDKWIYKWEKWNTPDQFDYEYLKPFTVPNKKAILERTVSKEAMQIIRDTCGGL
jgi:hypothetical protein